MGPATGRSPHEPENRIVQPAGGSVAAGSREKWAKHVTGGGQVERGNVARRHLESS